MKPLLPECIESSLTLDILKIIYSYVPHRKKEKKTPNSICSISPNMEHDLRKIQHAHIKGKNEMYMRDLEDFIL